ncbi:hypothetical protein MRX96_008674 [Rhipicephalus microplus]
MPLGENKDSELPAATTAIVAVVAGPNLQPPPHFDFENPAAWQRWRQQYDDCSFATGLHAVDDEVRFRMLLYCMGTRSRDILCSLQVAEHSYAVLDTPKTLKRKLDACTDSAATVKRKLKLSLERERRLRRKVSSFNEIIDDLKHKQLISEDASAMLERNFMGIPLEVTKRLLKQTSSEGDKSSVKLIRDKYSPALRAFALTLQFYSTKAYNYVRETFQCSLPHPSTITKWYSSINGEPGFTSEAINAIRAKANEAKKNNKQLLCNLVVDEMAIRKHLEQKISRLRGYWQ